MIEGSAGAGAGALAETTGVAGTLAAGTAAPRAATARLVVAVARAVELAGDGPVAGLTAALVASPSSRPERPP